MVAAGLVGTPFPESTRPYAKITDHYGRWRGGNICGGICVLYTYDVCLREEAQPGVGRGGRENRFGALCDQIPCVLRMYRKCVTLRYVF